MPPTTVKTPTFSAISRQACQHLDPVVVRRRRSAYVKWALHTKIALVTAPSNSRWTNSQGDSATCRWNRATTTSEVSQAATGALAPRCHLVRSCRAIGAGASSFLKRPPSLFGLLRRRFIGWSPSWGADRGDRRLAPKRVAAWYVPFELGRSRAHPGHHARCRDGRRRRPPDTGELLPAG